jgi:hypothetical protein
MGDSVHHAQTGAENRHERELLAGHLPAAEALEWRLDVRLLERKVLCRFVGHQHRNLVHEGLEVARVRGAIAQPRELVLDQRMVDDSEIGERLGHGSRPGADAR